MRIVSALLGLPLVATILIALVQATRHLAWEWPTHAHHHLLGGISTAVGLSLVSLLMIFGPLARSERWAWWALLVTGVSNYGGFWFATAAVGLGEPAAMIITSQAIQTLSYFAGLALAWRAVQRGAVI